VLATIDGSDLRVGESVREFIVELTHVQSIDEFVEAFNVGFCDKVGGHLHSLHLDAFHDYLSWPDEEQYRLVFRGWKDCSQILSAIHKPSGKSYLDNLQEIFTDNSNVDIVLK
jgi:hypothetical protein